MGQKCAFSVDLEIFWSPFRYLWSLEKTLSLRPSLFLGGAAILLMLQTRHATEK